MSKLIIKEVATQKGFNQSRLQMKAGVTNQLLYRYWHNFTKSVELEQLERIAKALGVKPGELIAGNDEYEDMKQSDNQKERD